MIEDIKKKKKRRKKKKKRKTPRGRRTRNPTTKIEIN